jgi:hypothetical protein
VNIDYIPAGPVAEAFHRSNALVRGLIGPVGSSKTSATAVELFARGCEQAPNSAGIRRTAWAILRNTYPELKSTTIRTYQNWLPFMEMRWDAPITGKIDKWLPDKTRIQIEFFFLALDRPDDIGKLKGLEVTGGHLNEAVEMGKEALDMLLQRTGRFPPKKDGGPTWRGVVMDTNPPDSDHWWFKLFEEQDLEGYEVFHQPGGLIEEKGKYLPNPEAENISNLDGGYDYYLRQVPGKTREWIKVFLQGQYGIVIDGKPVYPEYNDDLHCREISPIRDRPLIIGLDYGLTPAAVICQLSPRGQLLVLDELCAENMGISQFARDVLKPHLATVWNGYGFSAVGDPTGNRRAESDEKTCFMELAEQGIPASPAISNDFLKRREAVAKYLTRLSDGKPTLLVHPRCTRVRKGFMGGYCFKRIQVGGERYRDVADKTNPYSHPHDALQYAALYTQFVDSMNFVKKIDYREKVT